MRNLTLLLTLLFTCSVMSLSAAHVDIEKARQVATKQYVATHPSTLRSGEATLTLAYKTPSLLRSGGDEAGLYVFNAPNGFVIVAGDDRAYPILGYSHNASFDVNDMPPALQSWLQRYTDQIEEAVRRNAAQSPAVKAAWQTMEASGDVEKNSGELLETANWAQTTPYNNACPDLEGEATLTGCTATAMAILMRYHEWPAKGTGTHSYVWNNEPLRVDFADAKYYWGKLPMTTELLNAAPDSIRTNVADIMYHCGVSTESVYGVDVTTASTTSIVRALKNVFQYNKKLEIRGIKNSSYAEWEELIVDEIKAKRPLFYRGTSSLGGHIFICDGYEEYEGEVKAHINWGWGGSYNGYFSLNALKPGDMPTFSIDEQIIVGVEPDKTGDDYIYSAIQLVDTQGGLGISMNVSEVKKGELFFIHSSTIINTDMNKYEGELAVGLYSAKDSLKEVISEPSSFSLSTKGVISRILFDTCKVVTSDIDKSDYLRIITRVKGGKEEDWLQVDGVESVVSQLPASGYQVVEHKVTWDLPTTITKKLTGISENDVVIHGQDYTFTLTPKANAQDSVYAVTVNGELLQPAKANTSIKTYTVPYVKGDINIVVSGEKEYIPVTAIALSENELKLKTGTSHQFEVSLLPEKVSNNRVSWRSLNTTIAVVNQNGLLETLDVGESKIIVTSADNPTLADTCIVTVIPKIIPVTSIAFSQDTIRLEFGGKQQLTYTLLPDDASLKEVTWKSLDEKVATVSEAGEVTAISADTTQVVVFSSVESIRDTCVVIVKPPYIHVTGVNISSTEKSMKIGESITLNAIVLPLNATNKAISWKSTDNAIAEVDSNGKVTAKALGKASIVVITEESEKSDTCKVQVIDQFIEVISVKLSSNEMELTIGEEFTLPATVMPDNATNKALLWRSGDSDIASVSNSGVVTAKAIGETKIFVETESGGKKDSCVVTVKAPVIRVVSVKLSEHRKNLEVGEAFTLLATITPEEATNKTIVWTTTDQQVATVNAEGKIGAAGPGEAKIIATSVDGDKADTCVVTVTQRVTGLTLNYSTLDLQRGDSLLLLAFVKPANASNQLVTWKSNDPTIATINADGSVKGIALGKTYITATTADNNKTAQCVIEVKESVATIYVDSITLDITRALIKSDSILTLKATIHPANATNKAITWSSDNYEVAMVDKEGHVTAKKQGVALITATSTDGLRTITSRVTVFEPEVEVTGITLNENEVTMGVAQTFQLTATVAPANATHQAVVWSTSDATIATVDINGLVTALAAGKATITATSEEGDFEATCDVTVKNTDEVEVTPSPVGSDNKGVVMVGLNLPTEALFTGSFLVQMPDGFRLTSETAIADELQEELQLNYVTLVNDTWRITISKKGNKATDITSYREIVKIAYEVEPTVEDGNYEMILKELELTFDDDKSISEALINVPVEIDRKSGILAPNDSEVELRIVDNQLVIRSSLNEGITLYNLQGKLLRAIDKQANEATIDLPGSRHDIYIVRGDSGWAKKIRRD